MDIFNQLRRFVRTPTDQDPPFLQENHDSNEESKHKNLTFISLAYVIPANRGSADPDQTPPNAFDRD